jgi:hypothetical protein
VEITIHIDKKKKGERPPKSHRAPAIGMKKVKKIGIVFRPTYLRRFFPPTVPVLMATETADTGSFPNVGIGFIPIPGSSGGIWGFFSPSSFTGVSRTLASFPTMTAKAAASELHLSRVLLL